MMDHDLHDTHAPRSIDEVVQRAADAIRRDPYADELPTISEANLRRSAKAAIRFDPNASREDLVEATVHVAKVHSVIENNKAAAELKRRVYIADLHEKANQLAIEWLARIDPVDVIHTPLADFNEMAAALVERAHEAAAAICAQCERYEFEEE